MPGSGIFRFAKSHIFCLIPLVGSTSACGYTVTALIVGGHVASKIVLRDLSFLIFMALHGHPPFRTKVGLRDTEFERKESVSLLRQDQMRN